MIRRKLLYIVLLIFCAAEFAGCNIRKTPPHGKITSINIVDRNGLSETISSKDRLEHYQNVNFLQSQPYQKVLRVFGRQPNGAIRSCITSYHPNGQPRQYLEALNGRACGIYREWHANGQLKLEANVIGGTADINTAAEETWLFDKTSRAWNDEGQLIASIPYSKGELEGTAVYYFPGGRVWKLHPFSKNQLHGSVKAFFEDGCLLQNTLFCKGLKDGKSERFWPEEKIACDELFQQGLLVSGAYYNKEGCCIAEVNEKEGWRAVFNDAGEYQLQQYQMGKQEGCVKTFNCRQQLVRSYFLKQGLKHGEESFYLEESTPSNNFETSPRRLLSVPWVEGTIQGVVKSWYPNGKPESQREMHANKKNGMCSAWYREGGLMLIEEYQHSSLVSGEYFRKGDRIPVSKVINGKGTATLYDADGSFLRKITYRNGHAVE